MLLRCSDPHHALRSSEPDWRDELGRGSKSIDGLLCPACARLRPIEAEPDDTHEAARICIWSDGRIEVTVPEVYLTGEIVGERVLRVAAAEKLTPGEAGALASIRAKLFSEHKSLVRRREGG